MQYIYICAHYVHHSDSLGMFPLPSNSHLQDHDIFRRGHAKLNLHFATEIGRRVWSSCSKSQMHNPKPLQDNAIFQFLMAKE